MVVLGILNVCAKFDIFPPISTDFTIIFLTSVLNSVDFVFIVFTRALCKQMHMQTTNDSCHVIISNATTIYVITLRNLPVICIAPVKN